MRNIVPTHKSDLQTCHDLERATDSEVVEVIPELLKWVQDINWPVAQLVIARIRTFKEPIINPILEILESEDNVWKYHIIEHLLHKVDNSVLNQLKSTIERIADNPTDLEKSEEVHLVARNLLDYV